MENKVTNYSLSKQLHDLGFDCESHTGTYYLGEWNESNCLHRDTDRPDPIKAYDCHDLLMRLAECSSFLNLYPNESSQNCFHAEVRNKPRLTDTQPQNALAKAIIEILQTKD